LVLMKTLRSKIAKSLTLSERQKNILVGSMLGDGYLVKTTGGFAFRVNHGLAQKAYLDWKYEELRDFVNSPPRQSNKCYYFRTVTHEFFYELRLVFYEDKRKKLPSQFEKLVSPLALAVWIMDDGSRDANGLRINTQSFSFDENQTIVEILRAKFGFVTRLNRDKDKFRLRISAQSMPLVRQLVTSHTHPDMLYKLSP